MAAGNGNLHPVRIVFGGDAYLNDQEMNNQRQQACNAHPDAEVIDLDASVCDGYAFDEAVSPSLLSDMAVVSITNLQNADDKLADAMIAYTKQAAQDPLNSSMVICQHEGGMKSISRI